MSSPLDAKSVASITSTDPSVKAFRDSILLNRNRVCRINCYRDSILLNRIINRDLYEVLRNFICLNRNRIKAFREGLSESMPLVF